MLDFVSFCATYRLTSAYRLMGSRPIPALEVFSASCFPACPPLVQDGGDGEGGGGKAFEDGAFPMYSTLRWCIQCTQMCRCPTHRNSALCGGGDGSGGSAYKGRALPDAAS